MNLANVPAAVVQGLKWTGDERKAGALLAGPGLGRDDRAKKLLKEALAAGPPVIIDADALRLVDSGAGCRCGITFRATADPDAAPR